MRILILGGDGYLGWPTAMRFSSRGHDVHVVDNYLRRNAHREAGTDSLTPIAPDLHARVAAWHEVTGRTITVTEGDLNDWETVESVFRDVQPQAHGQARIEPARDTHASPGLRDTDRPAARAVRGQMDPPRNPWFNRRTRCRDIQSYAHPDRDIDRFQRA